MIILLTLLCLTPLLLVIYAVLRAASMADERYIDDGFGNYYPATCPDCGAPMQIVRPGDSRCSKECYMEAQHDCC